jgi:hypothetical protein
MSADCGEPVGWGALASPMQLALPSGPCFLSLPAEIRNTVYELLLISGMTLLHWFLRTRCGAQVTRLYKKIDANIPQCVKPPGSHILMTHLLLDGVRF